jgi:mannose-6-phosphate isomerase-like protein (cupin superfamily)
MNFKKNKYTVIKKAISEELTKFCCDYFALKRQVAQTMFNARYISPYSNEFGVWNDQQVPKTYSHYADIVMETLLVRLLPVMEKTTGLKLNPNYSYARIYKKGDILHRHKDRFSCEISTTLNLGGDPWPIYLEPNSEIGGIVEGRGYVSNNTKGIKVDLKPGDMLVYRGNELEHWREKFKGENCAQVFLHYNNLKTKGSKENIYDRRPHVGLPSWFKK